MQGGGGEVARLFGEIDVEELTSESLVPIALRSADGWGRVCAFVSTVMQKKMKIEWERRIYDESH